MLRIVLATTNAHKVSEFQALFDASGLAVEVLPFAGDAPAETGTSFAENALIKARAAAGVHIAIADDSGIVVDVMGGGARHLLSPLGRTGGHRRGEPCAAA